MSDGDPLILVVDDEPEIRRFLRIGLSAHGYRIAEAARGGEALRQAEAARPALVVLDLGLPDMDGQDVIRKLREWSAVPVIVLSVRAAEREKVAALDAGANDYVTKPFGIAELLARVRAALRARPADSKESSRIVVGDLAIDIPAHRVTVAGREVKLTRKEFAMLRILARDAGRVITHRALLRELWGKAHEGETHYLRVYVGHLRQKLGDDPAAPRYIENEPGIGYRLIDCVD